MNTESVNIIFGMKVRQARLEANLSLSEFANRCDLSPSYITEIEKGRKYPKADKIMKMAEVLCKDYDDLVSIKLSPSLTYLGTMLSSPLLQQFPFEEFGLEVSNLVSLFTRTPNKASALAHAFVEIARQYNMKDEHFLRAALRSYQEMHENYFQEIEDAATEFAKEYGLEEDLPLQQAQLEDIICRQFGYELNPTQLATQPLLSTYRSVYIGGKQPTLLINPALLSNQIKFVFARELGYQFLQLEERSNTSAPESVESFQQVLNDFKASYFAGALLMPRQSFLADLRVFFQLKTWSETRLVAMLDKYDATPEMLLYRISELLPQFFGVKLHFLRFNGAGNDCKLVKQLSINRLLLRNGIGSDEHYCHRWLGIRLLRQITALGSMEQLAYRPLMGVQIQKFLDLPEQIFTFGFARPLALSPEVGSSVTIGFHITSDLKRSIHFLEDPAIPVVTINETCERCPLTAEQCQERAAEPSVLHAKQEAAQREAAFDRLVTQMRAQ